LPLFSGICVYMCQGMIGGFPFHKVPWKDHAMDICGGCYSNGTLFLFTGCGKQQYGQQWGEKQDFPCGDF